MKPTRVLFTGNSHTHCNGLPPMFADLAAAAVDEPRARFLQEVASPVCRGAGGEG